MKKAKKVIVCDAILDEGVKLLREAEDIECIEAAKVPKDELLGMLGDVDVAITRSSTEVSEAFLNAAKYKGHKQVSSYQTPLHARPRVSLCCQSR